MNPEAKEYIPEYVEEEIEEMSDFLINWIRSQDRKPMNFSDMYMKRLQQKFQK